MNLSVTGVAFVLSQCSRELGNALFSTCAHYNWRLVSNKIPGILAMMQMTQGRQQQRSETPEKQQVLHATRKRRREAKSPDQRERRLERQAATEQTVFTSNELVCDSSRKGKSAKHVATTELLIEKRAIRLLIKEAREVISVDSDEHMVD